MGMKFPCPQPKWKMRINCARLNGVHYYHKKVNTSHINNIKSFVVVLNSINILSASKGTILIWGALIRDKIDEEKQNV